MTLSMPPEMTMITSEHIDLQHLKDRWQEIWSSFLKLDIENRTTKDDQDQSYLFITFSADYFPADMLPKIRASELQIAIGEYLRSLDLDETVLERGYEPSSIMLDEKYNPENLG